MSQSPKSFLIQMMFDSIPKKERDDLFHKKRSSISPNKEMMRIQCYIPKESYAVLSYWGALHMGETVFFSGLCNTYIEDKMRTLGLLDRFIRPQTGGV